MIVCVGYLARHIRRPYQIRILTLFADAVKGKTSAEIPKKCNVALLSNFKPFVANSMLLCYKSGLDFAIALKTVFIG